ncbi:breast carcinoma-amplified sequence 1 isoform X3 [Engraulis encrasicolus]|uniref:breast carcinoma-amplified sequence 1 isoform X3 n=1 Tax=Engraulis encrasicolus TaxID=184585 RepID=UPI002FD32CB1
MGNEVSSHKKKGQKGKVQNGGLNGHAVNVSDSDLTQTEPNEVTTTQSSTTAPPSTETCQTDGGVPQHSNDIEPLVIKDSTEPEQSEAESLQPGPTVTEQSQAEEHPVMNFFKSLVSPAKAPNKAADVPTDQAQEETAGTTTPETVQEVDVAKAKAALPTPPEPPKMEAKAEAAAKTEEVQDSPKDAGAKPKQAKENPFSKFFSRSKEEPTPTPEEVQVEVEPVDASKAATLEASAKVEAAPAAAAAAEKVEEKKAEKAASPFANLFSKPKALLDQAVAKIQAVASTSGIGGAAKSAGRAPEPAKEAPAAAASPEPPQETKAKEEVKTAPPTAPPAPPPPVEKSVESAENASPTIPRREKRNSIQLFFKTLSQKRHSDAGVQTEAAVPAAAEKGK